MKKTICCVSNICNTDFMNLIGRLFQHESPQMQEIISLTSPSHNLCRTFLCCIVHKPVSINQKTEGADIFRRLSLTFLGIFLAGHGDHLSQGDEQAEGNPRAQRGAHVCTPDMQRPQTQQTRKSKRARPRATASRLRNPNIPEWNRLLDERLRQTETSSLFTPPDIPPSYSHSPPLLLSHHFFLLYFKANLLLWLLELL